MMGGGLNGITLPSPGGLGVRLGEGSGMRAAGRQEALQTSQARIRLFSAR
jgi:hypothetical protein